MLCSCLIVRLSTWLSLVIRFGGVVFGGFVVVDVVVVVRNKVAMKVGVSLIIF